MDYNILKKNFQEKQDTSNELLKHLTYYLLNIDGKFSYDGSIYWTLGASQETDFSDLLSKQILTLLEEKRKFPLKGSISFNCNNVNTIVKWMPARI